MTATRILLVAAASSTTGGGERHVANLLTELVSRGYDCALAFPGAGDLGELARSLAVRTYEVPIGTGVSISRVAALRSVIESEDPSIVHAHGTRAALFARLADRHGARRVVYTVHGFHLDKGSASWFKMLAERFLVRKTAMFVMVCDANRRSGIQEGVLDAEKTRVVYNGIDGIESPPRGAFRAELGVSADTPLIVHIGRLSFEKNQVLLVRAFARLRGRLPGCVLAMVCPGDEARRAELQRAARSYGIEGSVRWVEPRADLSAVYVDADVFALPSLWEGFPYVILEAMAHGCPIVATSVDGIPEAVRPGIDGILVEPGDVRAFSDALDRCVRHRGEALERAQSAQRRAREEFTLEKMVDQTIAVYREVSSIVKGQ